MAVYDAITKKEEAFIKDNFGKMTIGEIATALGRSYFTIQKNLSLLGLVSYERWTEEEDAFLLEYYGKIHISFIASKLGKKESSIYNRIRRLKKNGRYTKFQG